MQEIQKVDSRSLKLLIKSPDEDFGSSIFAQPNAFCTMLVYVQKIQPSLLSLRYMYLQTKKGRTHAALHVHVAPLPLYRTNV